MIQHQTPTASHGTGARPQGGSGGGSTSSTSTSSSGGLIIRKNQSALSDKEWNTLICAIKELKKDKGSRNWDYFTGLHRQYMDHEDAGDHVLPHLNGEDLHIHSSFYWLAWHRKVVLEFEERLRDYEPGVSIPYWNWVNFREIPDELGKKLFGWMHVSRAVFHNPKRLPTRGDFDDMMAATRFDIFDNELAFLHGQVHNWVGGEMRNPRKSPNDPLFFLHHAFIDKVWYDWAKDHPSQPFPSEYLEFTLPPWKTTVAEVLNIGDLDYRYLG
jgi:tyrosinase